MINPKVMRSTKRESVKRATPLFNQDYIKLPVYSCSNKSVRLGVIDGWVYMVTDLLAIAVKCNVYNFTFSFETTRALKGEVLFSPKSKEFYYNHKLLNEKNGIGADSISNLLGRYLFNMDGLIDSGASTYEDTERWLADTIGSVPCLCNRDVLKDIMPTGSYGITQTLAKGYDNLVLIAYNSNIAVLSPLIDIGKDYEHYYDIITAIDILETAKNIYIGFNYKGEMFVCKKDMCVILKSVVFNDRKAKISKSALNCECGIAINASADRVRCLENDWSEKICGSLDEVEERRKINSHIVRHLKEEQGLVRVKKERNITIKKNNRQFSLVWTDGNIEVYEDVLGQYQIISMRRAG